MKNFMDQATFQKTSYKITNDKLEVVKDSAETVVYEKPTNLSDQISTLENGKVYELLYLNDIKISVGS